MQKKLLSEMKRFSILAAVGRAIGSSATSSVPIPSHRRHLQTALYVTASSSPEKRLCNYAQPIGSVSYGVAGTMFFSVSTSASASSIVHDDDARSEPPPSLKFAPKTVVLYQYEACPFCNKVKGIVTLHLPFFGFFLKKQGWMLRRPKLLIFDFLFSDYS